MEKHPLHQFRFCPVCGSAHFEENNIKSKKCQDCGFVYYFNSAAAVVAFITDAKGRLLLAERSREPAKGTLDLPGGFVDMFETAEEAIIREVNEETSLVINQPRYCFSLPNIYLYSGFEVHTLDMFFEIRLDTIDITHPADDVARLLLLEKDEINPDLIGLTSIREGVKKWLEKDAGKSS